MRGRCVRKAARELEGKLAGAQKEEDRKVTHIHKQTHRENKKGKQTCLPARTVTPVLISLLKFYWQ